MSIHVAVNKFVLDSICIRLAIWQHLVGKKKASSCSTTELCLSQYSSTS